MHQRICVYPLNGPKHFVSGAEKFATRGRRLLADLPAVEDLGAAAVSSVWLPGRRRVVDALLAGADPNRLKASRPQLVSNALLRFTWWVIRPVLERICVALTDVAADTACAGSGSVPYIAWTALASAPAYAFAPAVSACTNWAWNCAACALSAWYAWPWAPNMEATVADTSSRAGGITPVVAAAAAELASFSVDPIPARFDAAADTMSGVAVRNDIVHLSEGVA